MYELRECLAEIAEIQATRALEHGDFDGAKLHRQFAAIQRWAAERDKYKPLRRRLWWGEEDV